VAVIKIKNFGGLRPSVSAQVLPDDGAQVAQNLLASTAEFRPLLGPDPTPITPPTPVSNPVSIYRYPQVGGTWFVSASHENVVRGQINGDEQELTYGSVQDGSIRPRIFPSGLNLGVPAPLVAPTLSITYGDTFTETVRQSQTVAAGIEAVNAVHDNLTSTVQPGTNMQTNLGLYPTMGVTKPGYFPQSLSLGSSAETQVAKAYRVNSFSSAFTGGFQSAYVSANDYADNFAWIADPALQGYWSTMPAGTIAIYAPLWAAAGCAALQDHYCIPFTAFAKTYTLAGGASTALAAIELPGTSTGEKLYTSPEVTAIVAVINNYLSVTNPVIKPKFDALTAKVSELMLLLDGGTSSYVGNTMKDYYATANVTSEINSAIAAFAAAVADAAINVASAKPTTTDTGGGFIMT